ncbi:hypothetical protein FRC12_014341 [Ceratobasidium sp. 428]|nr:hypothetical protein FRC12_014341 [Ceratobasidium sp. 428]
MVHFKRLGSKSDAEAAIHSYKQVITIASASCLNTAGYYDEVSDVYRGLFERFGGEETLKNLAYNSEQALLLTPDGDFDMPQRLVNAGSAKAWLSIYLNDREQLQQSFSYIDQAEQHISDIHQNNPLLYATLLEGIGSAYNNMLFNCSGLSEHAEKAVNYLERAVQLTAPSHSVMVRRLYNLGSAYISLFVRLGQLDHLHKAVTCTERAVFLSSGNSQEQARCLSNLAEQYCMLYTRTHGLKHLDKSVSCAEQAIQLIPESSPEKSDVLRSLGNSYIRLSECLGEAQHTSKGLRYLEQALLLLPEKHLQKHGFLEDLNEAYQLSYLQTKRLEHLNQAIGCLNQALVLTSDTDRQRPWLLEDLGDSHRLLFCRLDTLETAKKAIGYYKQAISLIPENDPPKPAPLDSLGRIYICKNENSPWALMSAQDLPERVSHPPLILGAH